MCMVRPSAFAAATASLVSVSVFGLRCATSMPIGAVPGANAQSNSSRFATSLLDRNVTPVTLAPGRFMLATRPTSTGSTPVVNTMGIVVVAAFAAYAGGVVLANMTLTCRFTNSTASAGRRSLLPSANRCSTATFRPTTKPTSRSPCSMAAIRVTSEDCVWLWSMPITGIAPCCARAASGITAAPPRARMKSRRFIPRPRFRNRHRIGSSASFEVAEARFATEA